jgi:hypothetical protein
MISKIQKAKRYAAEPERITFESFEVTFRGDHGTYHVTYDIDKGWTCQCHYFDNRGVCSHTMALERILGDMVERAELKPSVAEEQ